MRALSAAAVGEDSAASTIGGRKSTSSFCYAAKTVKPWSARCSHAFTRGPRGFYAPLSFRQTRKMLSDEVRLVQTCALGRTGLLRREWQQRVEQRTTLLWAVTSGVAPGVVAVERSEPAITEKKEEKKN